MRRLSVNINKIATLRNARNGAEPSLMRAVAACIAAGAHGITVHPRQDARHITMDDVDRIAKELAGLHPQVEFNIEGDLRADLMDKVLQHKPCQCTLVPVLPGEITSQGGWPQSTDEKLLGKTLETLRHAGIRTSVFINPAPDAVRWAHELGADRVELFTEPYAKAARKGQTPDSMAALNSLAAASEMAEKLGLGVNAGHDLNLDNLGPLLCALPQIVEVSIGHALISEAVFVGLEPLVKRYVEVVANPVAQSSGHTNLA